MGISKYGAGKKKKRARNSNIGQDEAALKIQTQYRGYRVRKDYCLEGKKFKTLDEKTILFMKGWGKKWKAKSMFQVLLLYRAQRLQDLTYFCQQVHIYNQNVAGVLMGDTKKTVPMDQIKPGGSVKDFLGPITAPPVSKMPFRYNDILKFDPMEPKGSAFGDDESWDEPLKRGRHQGPKDKHFAYKFRDQEVQTANLESPEVTQTLDELINKEICPEELNFIDTPYTRDPKNIRQMYSDQKYRNKYNTPKKQRAPSPPRPMSRTRVPSVNNYADINEEIQNESYFTRGETPPTRAPPPPPVRGHVENRQQDGYNRQQDGYNRQQDSYSRNSDYGKPSSNVNNYSRTNTPAKYTPKPPARENNPVHELQMLAKQGNRNDDEDQGDDPPFNFQAMLRKTNVNRESLRRVRANNNTPDIDRNGNQPYMNGNTITYNPQDNGSRTKHDMNGYPSTRGTYQSNYEDKSRNVNQRNYNQNYAKSDYTNSYGKPEYNQTNSYGKTEYNQTNSYGRADNNQNSFGKPNYQRTNSSDYLSQTRNNLNRTKNGYGGGFVKTELAPGIVLEGIEVEL